MQRLDKDSLYTYLRECPTTQVYVLAISGGLDSSVLLHLFHENLSRLPQQVQAIYVDHGLQSESNEWQVFCARQAKKYDIAFHACQIGTGPTKADSVENWARTERYKILTSRMQENDILFTAHHLDDQVETFFLQALRGTGARGLAAMSPLRQLANGYHARPLLSFSRQQLQEYARKNQLEWIEDPSNADSMFDRNYLRQTVMPLVETRWPGYRKTIARLAEHQAEIRDVLEDVAEQDLTYLLDDEEKCLQLERMKTLSFARQKNVIRYWARRQQLSTPNSVHLQQIFSDVVNAADDATPCVNWADVECRRYRDGLYLQKKMLPHDSGTVMSWDMSRHIEINGETLSAVTTRGKGLAKDSLLNKRVSIRFRQGGERICPAPGRQHKTLKQIYQESGVLPWCRDRIPLIYLDDELAAVPGICVAGQYSAAGNAVAVSLQWSGLQKCREAHG